MNFTGRHTLIQYMKNYRFEVSFSNSFEEIAAGNFISESSLRISSQRIHSRTIRLIKVW